MQVEDGGGNRRTKKEARNSVGRVSESRRRSIAAELVSHTCDIGFFFLGCRVRVDYIRTAALLGTYVRGHS